MSASTRRGTKARPPRCSGTSAISIGLRPVWVTVTGPTHQFNVLPDRNGRAVINTAAASAADPAGRAEFRERPGRRRRRSKALLADPRRSAQVPRPARSLPRSPTMPPARSSTSSNSIASGQFNYLELLREARPRFARHNWLITVAVPVDEPWDLPALRRRSPTSCSSWPMTSIRTTGRRARSPRSNGGRPSVAAAVRQIPRDKVIVTIGNYAYDWHDGTGDPDNVEEAWVDAGDSDAPPVFDRVSGNSTFAYEDENGHRHTVWLLDAASAFNELTIARPRRHPRSRAVAARRGGPGPLVDLRAQRCRCRRNAGGLDASRPGHQRRYRGPGRDPADHRASDTRRAAADARTERPARERRFRPRAAAVHDHANRLSPRPGRADLRRRPRSALDAAGSSTS